MTDCNTGQLGLSFLRKRKLTVDFEGGSITSDAGLLLVRQADQTLGLLYRLTHKLLGASEEPHDWPHLICLYAPNLACVIPDKALQLSLIVAHEMLPLALKESVRF